jgi:hypothetical protein
MILALQLVGSFGIFLALLAAGMAVPFAIAVPGVIYLLMQNGLTALKGIGLVTWGSMNSFTLTAIPLFGGVTAAGRAAADEHRGVRAVRLDQRVVGGDGGVDRGCGAAAAGAAAL